MNKMGIVFSFFLFLFLTAGCSSINSPDENPAWINELIKNFENAPAGNPPQSIWRFTYKGETVYYVPPQCCDQFSTLYSGEGYIICAPDGGITGQGDGGCPDFWENAQNRTLIWKDSRNRN
jgi:hypothetical protein